MADKEFFRRYKTLEGYIKLNSKDKQLFDDIWPLLPHVMRQTNREYAKLFSVSISGFSTFLKRCEENKLIMRHSEVKRSLGPVKNKFTGKTEMKERPNTDFRAIFLNPKTFGLEDAYKKGDLNMLAEKIAYWNCDLNNKRLLDSPKKWAQVAEMMGEKLDEQQKN